MCNGLAYTVKHCINGLRLLMTSTFIKKVLYVLGAILINIIIHSALKFESDGAAIPTARKLAERMVVQGDSGSPLMVKNSAKNQVLQVGLMSGSPVKECGTANITSYYTRVSYYLKWIMDNIHD